MAKGILKLEDGREVEVEYNPNDYKRKNPYARVATGETYYFITSYGEVAHDTDKRSMTDNSRYDFHGYFNDEEFAEKVARAEKLRHDLEAFSREHDGDKIDWDNIEQVKYSISYDYDMKQFFINTVVSIRHSETTYFYTDEIAKQAMDEFKDDLMWLYTESGL